MANLTGWNGQLMINTTEAEYDRQQAAQAQRCVQQAKQLLRPERLDPARYAGPSAGMFEDLIVQLNAQLRAMDDACADVQRFIADTVNHYVELDAELAGRMGA
ncbi:MAG: hypothetical protein FWC27_12955 [Firmicutes bacterium]|nr:hypothetical protein [Bacillota bacterium]